jgi:hypothetical protein
MHCAYEGADILSCLISDNLLSVTESSEGQVIYENCWRRWSMLY